MGKINFHNVFDEDKHYGVFDYLLISLAMPYANELSNIRRRFIAGEDLSLEEKDRYCECNKRIKASYRHIGK